MTGVSDPPSFVGRDQDDSYRHSILLILESHHAKLAGIMMN
jgi:hypothetical protein